jgi:hypothetical protein
VVVKAKTDISNARGWIYIAIPRNDKLDFLYGSHLVQLNSEIAFSSTSSAAVSIAE